MCIIYIAVLSQLKNDTNFFMIMSLINVEHTFDARIHAQDQLTKYDMHIEYHNRSR